MTKEAWGRWIWQSETVSLSAGLPTPLTCHWTSQLPEWSGVCSISHTYLTTDPFSPTGHSSWLTVYGTHVGKCWFGPIPHCRWENWGLPQDLPIISQVCITHAWKVEPDQGLSNHFSSLCNLSGSQNTKERPCASSHCVSHSAFLCTSFRIPIFNPLGLSFKTPYFLIPSPQDWPSLTCIWAPREQQLPVPELTWRQATLQPD